MLSAAWQCAYHGRLGHEECAACKQAVRDSVPLFSCRTDVYAGVQRMQLLGIGLCMTVLPASEYRALRAASTTPCTAESVRTASTGSSELSPDPMSLCCLLMTVACSRLHVGRSESLLHTTADRPLPDASRCWPLAVVLWVQWWSSSVRRALRWMTRAGQQRWGC